ncbi:hypothetical protein BDV95DRAFT_611925 [Massariosphaeria phaeospora]|uniref:PARP catalytic domain-containing protein n=1 Tax=Massariosphaeria phaeospora TaxID=100035 RepID=A0A7C8HZA7_9PLEO|nr:hypothetical protein BDV95DRAFT_611925 [Massariosphaeria phaeospora]
MLLPHGLIIQVLTDAGCSAQLQHSVRSLLDEHRYLSVFKALAWLRSVPSFPNTQIVIALLDGLLPNWTDLRLWEPRISRITQFEQVGFTKEQKEKLGGLLSLEGPDDVTKSEVSLGQVKVEQRQRTSSSLSSQQTDATLDLLCRTQKVGPSAVDLFIHLRLHDTFDLDAFSMVKTATKWLDDLRCLDLRMLLVASQDSDSVSHQMNGFIKTLPSLQTVIPRCLNEPILVRSIEQVENVMNKAQRVFNKSLETGSGRHMGMLIHALGDVILKATSIHTVVSSHLISSIRRFPSYDSLKPVFERIRTSPRQYSVEECRFKSYLASTLGGRPVAFDSSITATTIQAEITFWKHQPDTARKDLAHAVESINAVSYSQYTSWLLVMLREDDQFIREVREIMINGMENRILRLANYLSLRRKFNLMRDETWLLLFASLINDPGPTYLENMAKSITAHAWLEFVTNLPSLVDSIRGHLPEFGVGLTHEQLSWWEALGRKKGAVQMLLRDQDQTLNPTWLYFTQHQRKIQGLLDILANQDESHSNYGKVLIFLSAEGGNVLDICDCVNALSTTSSFGHAVFARQILRALSGHGRKVSRDGLKYFIQLWTREDGPLTSGNKKSLLSLESILRLPTSIPPSVPATLRDYLKEEYTELIARGGELEKLRLKLHQSNPNLVGTILNRQKIENNTRAGRVSTTVPEDMADAVECIGPNEFEVAFPLTGLNDIHRAAKGISPDARLLIIRILIRPRSTPGVATSFCIHFEPSQKPVRTHMPWHCSSGRSPDGATCTTRPTLFTYVLSRLVDSILQTPSLQIKKIHVAVSDLISTPPDTCLVCMADMGVRLWKPATCSRNCSISLRSASLEVRLHNLLIDPKAIDLLLTSVYGAATEPQASQLLPFCPVPLTSIKLVIDSMPSMRSLATVTDLRVSIQGTDAHGKNREALLSWLCLRFRGFMLSVPDGFKVPSLGLNAEQFLIPNSNPGKEKAFKAHYKPSTGSTVVFHGTRASRLFPILSEGLQIAKSGTAMQVHGAAHGEGVYCGHDPATSWGFSTTTGPSWSQSALKNMHVLLGCELAPASAPTHGSIHVITDESRLVVRYVFLLPPSFQPPIRNHVESAMMAGFASLRTGLQS